MTLIAPAAAMNKTGDEEYSRSVATTNLFFNNRIRGLQSKTIEHLSKFIQLHAKYSGVVYEKIADIIRDSVDKHDIKRTVERYVVLKLKILNCLIQILLRRENIQLSLRLLKSLLKLIQKQLVKMWLL